VFLSITEYIQAALAKNLIKACITQHRVTFSSNHTACLLHHSRAACYFIDEIKVSGAIDHFRWPDLAENILQICFSSRVKRVLKKSIGQDLVQDCSLQLVLCCHPGTVLAYWN